MARNVAVLPGLTLLAAFGCGGGSGPVPPAAPLSAPTVLCGEREPRRACRSAAEVEGWLRQPNLQILGSAPTPGGTQDAELMTLALPAPPGQVVFRAKWRPHSSAGLFNEPRKELGAYAVQKTFLEPHEYVVPPTASHCFALAQYRAHVDRDAMASFEGTDCVYGFLSYWLEDVVEIEDAEDQELLDSEDPLDPGLFARSPVYRRSVADLNLLTYLIHHGDAHGKQFLATREPGRPRLYSVDNSVAFESVKNPLMLLRGDWSTLHVPEAPRAHVERLVSLTAAEWARLAVIEQFRREDGRLVRVPAGAPAGARDAGLRWVGEELQVGLTEVEIEGVAARARELGTYVSEGKLGLF